MDDQVARDNAASSPDNTPDDSDNLNNATPQVDAALLALKQHALEALLPIVDSMQEAPERKFEILITATRSSEDPSLLDKALGAAQQISDPNNKADALLDVLNEVNYYIKKQA